MCCFLLPRKRSKKPKAETKLKIERKGISVKVKIITLVR